MLDNALLLTAFIGCMYAAYKINVAGKQVDRVIGAKPRAVIGFNETMIIGCLIGIAAIFLRG